MGAFAMKHLLTVFAISLCAMPLLSAASGDGAFGGGFMDDLITPYDDTAVELPGEDARKPAVSRSAQLVDDSTVDTWGMRENESSSSSQSGKTSSPSSSSSSTKTGTSRPSSGVPASSGSSRSTGSSSSRDYDDSDSGTKRTVYDLDENNPFKNNYKYKDTERKSTGSARYETGSGNADRDPDRTVYDLDENNPFKNNYKYKDTERKATGSAHSGIDEVHQRIKDIMHESAPKQNGILDSMDDLMRNAGREAAREAPTTPDRWTRAPNGWFCDFDDAIAKAQQSGKAIAVFFHSSDNNNSRKFKSERMENSKFKNKMRGRLLVVYMDYPDNADTHKDRRNKDQVEHNRRIAEKFHVSNYPTLIFLDSSGKEIGRINDLKNSVTAFVDNADRIVPQKEEKPKNQGTFKVGGSLNDMRLPSDSSQD